MFKKNDLEKTQIEENLTTKLKSIKPIKAKFCPEPLELHEAIQILQQEQSKNIQIKTSLMAKIPKSNDISLEMQAHTLQKRIQSITNIMTTILTHLVVHKKAKVIALYHNSNTPHVSNVAEIIYKGINLIVCLPSKYTTKEFCQLPHKGCIGNYTHPPLNLNNTALLADEALAICKTYQQAIIESQNAICQKNKGIHDHNRTVKQLKRKLMDGSLSIQVAENKTPSVNSSIKPPKKDRDRNNGEFRMKGKIKNAA